MTLSEKQKEIIERLGIFYEEAGFQPAAARILGLLYISSNPELSFEQITATLQISKSATSNAINLLLNTDQIEYTTYLGDRKRYFRLKISNWRETFSKRIAGLTKLSGILKEVVEIRSDENPKFNKDLKEYIDFLNFVKQELPHLIEKWEKTKK